MRPNSRKKRKARWTNWKSDALLARAKLIQLGYNTKMDPDWFILHRVKALGL
jgi:hypothetical protein